MKMNGEGKKKHDCLQDFRHLLFSLNAQEGREELLHVQDQEGQPWDDTPRQGKEQ